VAYTPKWEPLADALKRVVATGVTEAEAKTDLCRAMADQKINVRVRIAASGRFMAGRVFSGGNVGVPSHLDPRDLDWMQSSPLRPWKIGPMPGQHYSWDWEDRPIDLIELSTADVTAILCGGVETGDISSATAAHETTAIRLLASHLRGNTQLTRAKAKALCKEAGCNVSDRGFQSRVWPAARTLAGLHEKASSGRKRKSPR
jgi:hypothetical protein